ncbi:hypothetical protein NHX12_031897 [Muraenolepis orangiensis]|uniref:Neurotrophin-4 n=1 Tax=Muraenolepis orangiensis TaxID=630683 RepID=A0A9Q0IJD7_9TELE|nr:hypothetical protein NHX12_031897 [Muraenolepis orangiensis]
MHWLPLVAMVIASALPFPYSPVTRIVAATTADTAGSHEDAGQPSPPPPPPSPLPAPAHNCSDGEASRDPCGGPDPDPPGDRHDAREPRRELPEELGTRRESEWSTVASGSDGDTSDIPPTLGGDAGGTPGSSCAEGDSAGSAVTRDCGRGDAGAEDSPRKENLHDSPDGGAVGDDRESPAADAQSGTLSRREETRVTAEAGAGSPAGEGEEGRSPGGPEWVGSAAGLKGRPGAGTAEDDPETGMTGGADGMQEVDDLFLDAHPRVLFSASGSPPRHPPLLLMLESGALPEGEGHAASGEGGEHETDEPPDGEGAAERGPGWAAAAGANRRIKRSDLSDVRRGERSVCESESVWVTDKKTAVDNHGRTVTILPVIQTPTGPLKQYFYETRCRRGDQPVPRGGSAAGARAPAQGPGLGVAGSGCLGVDKKQWKSECKPKHSFVRALAKDANNRMGWRWIRIDSSCVCSELALVSDAMGNGTFHRGADENPRGTTVEQTPGPGLTGVMH